jgi:hypothetical protein
MHNRKELTQDGSEVSGQHQGLISISTQVEHQGKEYPADPKPSVVGRLSKFFGWWVVIAGVSSYV